ncbi:MAG TPA: hypothetical protein VIS51_11085 [Solirubrobacterales bacterium]
MGKKSFGLLSAVVLAMAMLVLPVAQADDAERQSYKEAVEPICKANTQANERILKGVRGKVRAGKLKAAAGQFSRAATALRKTHKELKAVPQPPTDQAKLAKWLKYVEEEANLFQRTAKKLNAGDKNGALAMVIKLEHNANLANNQVLGFEFRYCRFEPSKFT